MKHWRNTNLEILSEWCDGILYHEKWKEVKGYEGLYEVSSFGRIKSFVVTSKGRIRKGVPAGGYPQVQLKGGGDNSFETLKIHRLVAIAFIPNPNNLPEVNHIKGDRGDCRVWKLEWSTPSDNMKHAYRELGKRNNLENQKGETHYNAKYTENDIRDIRKLYSDGKRVKEIAEMYKERTGAITRIIKRQRWAHIE